MFGFPSKTIFEAPRQGPQQCSGVIKKMMLANTNLDEMLKDPYCFNRIHVCRHLVRFFKIPKDSHHPMMWMSSCASRGDENHKGSSSSAARICVWRDTFARNLPPAYEFCKSVMRILRGAIRFAYHCRSRELRSHKQSF